jgi:uncharacterized membrane protein YqjE
VLGPPLPFPLYDAPTATNVSRRFGVAVRTDRFGYGTGMTQEARVPHDPAPDARPQGGEPTLGALVHQLSEEIPHLVRSELQLAQAEVAEKGRRVGIGLGMFSVAGLLAFFASATLVATAVLALAEVLPGWAAALVVAAVLLIAAGVFALVGKGRVSAGQPLKPERAVAGVREDVAILKEVKP